MATGSPPTGLTDDPRLLAGAAGGLVSAIAALAAFRGLPGGMGLFWLSPLPLFLAGLGFGQLALGIATATGALAILATAGGLPLLFWLALYGGPALLLVTTALRPQEGSAPAGPSMGQSLGQAGGQRLGLGLPLALLGLWPAGLLLLVALAAGDGGLEGALREAVETGMARMGATASEAVVQQIMRLQAMALSLWTALVLVANAAGAQGFLLRRGLALAPSPAWRAARLPVWYPALPGIAGLLWALADAGGDLLPMSLCLVLGVPLVLQGLAAMHTRLAGFSGRLPLLILLYVLILVFSLPGALILVALGLLEQYGRRNPPANM
ncbi:DUF2232 domain-containing protein [Roseomonas sp. GC11]|uniref:DUF2232 domain-containing protein n=1 Tax=Roseomonas sp. GC11 TaxID=2950546 RepID=UPI00210B6D5E|nr:DUF2232 domain-containing protein [Roseomonas sp. GC11]MCQ4159739.1 DUF2232 domain-containing protein [Roseomonas sp. GC11]